MRENNRDMCKILIIRFRRIGDAVLTSSICTTLKRSIPGCEIHYVLNTCIAPLFDTHPDIDKLITFSEEEKHSFFSYLRKIRKLMKTEKYDIIIDARSTLNTMYFPLFSLRSKYRIGRKKTYTRLIYNYRVDNVDINKNIIQHLQKLLDPLRKEFDIKDNTQFYLHCRGTEKSSYKSYMQSMGIDFTKPVIICAVCARLQYKRWPMSQMKTVLEKLLDKYSDTQLVFNYSGGQEKDFAQTLYKQMG